MARNRKLKFLVVIGKRNTFGLLQFSLVLCHQLSVDNNLRGRQCRSSDEFQSGVADELPCQPKERFFEIIIRFGGDLKVLKVLLPVEGDGSSLHFSFLDINLVSTKNDGNVFTNALKITMPVWDILVCDAGGNVKHDDAALALNIVSISKTAEFFLTGGVPDIEADCAKVGGEGERVNLDTKGGDIFLFKFSGQMALDKGSFSCAAIANENKLERWN